MIRGGVKGAGCPLHSPVSLHVPSRASPCAITFQLYSTYFSVVALPCYAFVAARHRTYCLSLQTSQEINFKSLIKFVAPISLLFLVTIKLRKHAV